MSSIRFSLNICFVPFAGMSGQKQRIRSRSGLDIVSIFSYAKRGACVDAIANVGQQKIYTLLKTDSSPLKIGHPKRIE